MMDSTDLGHEGGGDPIRSYVTAVLALSGLATGDVYASPSGDRGVSEITQLSLATAGGLIRTYVRARNGKQPSTEDQMRRAYLRWAKGQGLNLDPSLRHEYSVTGWLDQQPLMLAKRPRGNTTREALQAARGVVFLAANSSKGAAAVPRAAACGLFKKSDVDDDGLMWAFQNGVHSAALTHGHPVAHAATGAFAGLLKAMSDGAPLDHAVSQVLEHMAVQEVVADRAAVAHVMRHMEMAIGRSGGGGAYSSVRDFSGWTGYTAEQALAIGLWSARSSADLRDSLRLATDHGGERHTTASICGALWGAQAANAFMRSRGATAFDLGAPIAQPLEVLDRDIAPETADLTVIEVVAGDLTRIVRVGSNVTDVDRMRWPGW